jgi:DNA-directed RNA polymerase specialized sigma24 family protein
MTATRLTTQRREALGAFYAEHHRELAGRVQRRARGAGAAAVADACAYAWLQLARRADVRLDRGGLAWLALVASQEAWRLSAPGRERPAGLFLAEIDHERELPEPAGPAADPLERVIEREHHHARVDRFAHLAAVERRALLLQAGGYSYHEIAAMTASSYTAVNRRLTEGRNRLRGT